MIRALFLKNTIFRDEYREIRDIFKVKPFFSWRTPLFGDKNQEVCTKCAANLKSPKMCRNRKKVENHCYKPLQRKIKFLDTF